MPASALRQTLAGAPGIASPAAIGGKPAAMDEVYEASLKVCLQVLVAAR